ncbi:MAG: phosphatase PAP2 family protein [Mariprofundaceae bacterium]|nr:phosphatase PAP2 family protein [Mariprofundaceae bacterium]
MNSLNIDIFRIINDAHSPFFDAVIGIVSGLGDGLVIALCCAVLMLYRFRLGMAATVAFLLSGIIAQLLKRAFDMPRPPAVLENVHVLGSALHSHSFPSGHATSDGVMVLLAFLIWQCRDWRASVMAGLFLLAAYGRIYGGVHFPLDVVAGLLIGMATMWACHRWSLSWPVEAWQKTDWWWRIAGMIVVIEAGVLGLGYRMQPETAQPLAAILPLIALYLVMRFWKEEIHRER